MDSRVFAGALFVLILFVADFIHPLVWRGVWLAWAIYSAVAAALVWKRTRLPRWTASLVLLAGLSLAIALLAGSKADAQNLLWKHPVPVVAAILTGAALMLSEAKFAPAKWQRVREQGEKTGLLGMLQLRHIPDLR
jgi:hypothetical protein